MLHEKLKEYRKANKLTQQQLADVLNIERSTYAYYENGKHFPNISILTMLARIYAVPLDCLVGNDDIQNSLLEDDTFFYNEDSEQENDENNYLSKISREEQEALMLFRLIKNKDSALSTLKKLHENENK